MERLLNREDVTCIYVCTDSGREGEYIYRLVDQMAHVGDKDKRRVWIDSQTEEEILRGIREAKPLSEYDHLADAAYLRAKEDYLMGINFSRLLTQDSHPMHVRRHSILWQILWPHWAFLLYITIYSALSILRKFYIIICHFCLSHILSHLSSHEKFFRILFIRVIIHLSAFWCRQIKSY